MSDKSLNLDIEFGYDDLSKGLQDITYAGNQILKTFMDVGRGIEKAFNDVVREAKPIVSEIQAIGKEANRVFNQVAKDVTAIETAIRQADMSPWEKQADKFGQKIKTAQGEVARLQKELENVNATEAERAKVLETISKTQEKIKNLQAGQSKALDLAKLAESSKLAKGIISDIDKLLNSVGRQIEVVSSAWNTDDMTELERMAAGYAHQIELAQTYVQKLEERLKGANLVEADRLKIQQQIAAAQQKINSLQEAQGRAMDSAKIAADLQVFKSGIAKVDDTIQMVSQHIDEIGKAIRQADMKPWEKTADNYRQHIRAIVADIKTMETELQSVAHTDKERLVLQQKIAEAQKQATDLAAMQAIHVQRMRSDEQKQQRQGVVDGGRQGVQEVSTAAGLAGAALSLAVNKSVTDFAALDSSLTQFRAVTNATNDDVEKFKNTAYSLTILGKSSTEVAGLGVELAKAGLGADEVNRALGTLTKSSVAVGEDLNSTGVAIDAVRTQFGLGIDEIERVANGMVLAANESKISVADLNESYKYLGSTAAQANQPLEDVNAILTLLGNSGIKGSMAGNGMQNSLIRLADPKVRKGLKDIGVEVTDSQGRLRKMTDIVMDLKKSLTGVSQVNKAAFLKDQFGEVALNPLLALLNKTDDEIKKVRATALNWDGTLDKVSKTMQQGLNFSLQQMTKSFETFSQQFGESLGPVLIPVFSLLTKLFKLFEGLPGPIKTVISTGVAATAGFLTLAGGIGLAGLAIPRLIEGFDKARDAIKLYATESKLVTGANEAMKGSMALLNTPVSQLPGMFKTLALSVGTSLRSIGASAITASAPFLPFIALAAALYLAWEYNLGGFRDIVDMSLARIQDTFDIFQGWFDSFLSDNRVLWEQTWIALQDTLYTILGIMDAALSFFFDTVVNYFNFWKDVFTGNWGKIWDQVSEKLKSATDGMTKNLGHWLEQFGKTFQMGMNGLGEMAAGLWDMLTNPADMSGGIARVKAGFETLKKASGDAVNFVSKTWDDGMKKMADGVSKIPENISKQMAGYRRTGEAAVNSAQAAGAQAAAQRKRAAEQKKKEEEEALDPNRNALIESMLGKKGKGKSDSEKALDEWLRDTDAKYEKLVQDDKTLIESQKDVGAHTDDLIKKIGDAASKFAANTPEAIKFQKSVQGIGATCAATVDHVLELAGVTKDFQGVLGNKNWVPNYDALIKAGLATKIALKDIQAGDLVLGYDPNPNGTRGHIGVAIDNKRVMHAGSGAGKRVGLRQLATIDTIQAAFSPSLNAGDDVHGLRFNTDAFKSDAMVGVDKESAKNLHEVVRLQQKLTELVQKRAQYIGKPKELDTLNDAITKAETALSKAQEKAGKDANEFLKIVAKNNDEIAKMQAENAKAQAELGTDSLDALQGSREQAIASIHRERDERLRGFRGTAEQLSKMVEAYAQKELITNKKYDQDIIKERERRFQEMAQIQMEYQQEGLAKEQAAIDLRVRKEIQAITEMQKGYTKNGEEWQRLEDLKTEATKKGIDDRLKASLNAEIESAQSWVEALNSDLKDGQQALVSNLSQMLTEKLKSGQSGFKFEDIQNLAQSLGQDSIDGIASNLKNQLEEVDREIASRKERRGTTMTEKDRNDNENQLNALLKNREDRLRVINALQDSGMTGMVSKYQSLIPEITRANEEQERFLALTDGIGSTLSQIAGMFGEVGRSIASGISLVTTTVSAASQLAGSLGKKIETLGAPKVGIGPSAPVEIGTLFKSMSSADVSGIASILTTAVSIQVEVYKMLFENTFGLNDFVKKLTDERVNYELDKENKLAREKLEIRKAAGENVLQDELALIDSESDAQRKKLKQQMDENEKFRLGSGLLGTWTQDDYVNQLKTRLGLQAQLDDLDAKTRKDKEAAEKTDLQRQLDLQKDMYIRMSDTKILIAQNTNDKIAEINAQSEKEQADIYAQYLIDLLKMVTAGASAEQMNSLAANLQAKLAASDKKAQEQRRATNLDNQKAELTAQFDHQEATLSLMEDGAAKELQLLQVSKERQLAIMDAELDALDKGSQEYARLAQTRADAEITADEKIKKSREENEKNRQEWLDQLSRNIEKLKAKLTVGEIDDVLSQGRATLADLNKQEADAIKKANADYADNEIKRQQMISKIQENYALERQVSIRDLEKQVRENVIKDYESEQRKKLDAQTRPIEAIIKSEERRLKEIDKQNTALEHQLDLVDQRYQKELDAFNQRDKTEFNQKIGQVDLRAGMLAGIDYLANTNIQGDPLDRSSKESQRRGLNELLDLREQDAKSRLDLEEISKQQYLTELEQIILLRAAATQDAMTEAKTDKERADLKTALAEQYIQYQETEKDMIEELRSAERRQYEDSIKQNNIQRSEIQATVDVQKEKLDELNTAYQDNMDAIKLSLDDVTLSQDGWLQKLQGIAPVMAETARQVIGNLKAIRAEFEAPLAAAGINIGSSNPYGYGVGTPFYNADGSNIDSNSIPRRGSATTDSEGNFSVTDGTYWYRSTSEMQRASQFLSGLTRYAEGGDVPDLWTLRNDQGLIRVQGGERIKTPKQARAEDYFVSWMRSNGESKAINNFNHSVNIGHISVSRDVDLGKLDAVINKNGSETNRRMIRRMGPNMMNRG